ncbi:Hypothetical Protein FCC1311_036192 [Hondaea fermentalgiana]|uniref:Uncharacterized protein n=1 Tax=Hondaea fermentalgiana TaxID=2315210 RepID=A0A2R5G8M7_9STRA|nr:Hypothetical Protein FCC1311_036192 [Hondaea fermentalgiana]|eukprot:GBG27397.1 Hypothetical Protein FCC1311_036192 [Hondaea fermentalgiana]
MEGADSARFERLKEVYNKVIGAICLRGVTEDDAKACFADVLSNSKRFKDHHLTLVFQRLFMEQVPRNLKLEFQDVCEEFKVAASLERLDQITERRRTRSALACPASSAESADNAKPHQHDAMTPERMVTEAISCLASDFEKVGQGLIYLVLKPKALFVYDPRNALGSLSNFTKKVSDCAISFRKVVLGSEGESVLRCGFQGVNNNTDCGIFVMCVINVLLTLSDEVDNAHEKVQPKSGHSTLNNVRGGIALTFEDILNDAVSLEEAKVAGTRDAHLQSFIQDQLNVP